MSFHPCRLVGTVPTIDHRYRDGEVPRFRPKRITEGIWLSPSCKVEICIYIYILAVAYGQNSFLDFPCPFFAFWCDWLYRWIVLCRMVSSFKHAHVLSLRSCVLASAIKLLGWGFGGWLFICPCFHLRTYVILPPCMHPQLRLPQVERNISETLDMLVSHAIQDPHWPGTRPRYHLEHLVKVYLARC